MKQLLTLMPCGRDTLDLAARSHCPRCHRGKFRTSYLPPSICHKIPLRLYFSRRTLVWKKEKKNLSATRLDKQGHSLFAGHPTSNRRCEMPTKSFACPSSSGNRTVPSTRVMVALKNHSSHIRRDGTCVPFKGVLCLNGHVTSSSFQADVITSARAIGGGWYIESQGGM